MAKSPVSRQMSDEVARFLEGTASFADIVFGASEESNDSLENFCENEEESKETVEENKAFWETQDQLLQATVCKTSSIESKVRQATKEALREINSVSLVCVCRKPVAGGCRNCLQRELSLRLQNVGYNCAICQSKWKSSQEIPPGQHSYLEVVEKLSSKKGEMRVVIELNFRGEFEMARASEEYKRLISRLPEVFVGKTERLKALIKILCAAAKKCMKEKKMHMAPWRKQKYMQAKWLGTYERTVPATLPVGYSDRLPKPKASMLTFDLVDSLPALRCSTAVEVL
ncbi:uncharacterized protein LOC123195869 [Mangifera indica]|uniref:uncharacterized protein LOC123195869 n=1 Tax=Mangifera indica TaxID=29780 RepID=UPI001CF9DBB0|nr:uncharacterized protein LOC123195869 [Mangifera indica]